MTFAFSHYLLKTLLLCHFSDTSTRDSSSSVNRTENLHIAPTFRSHYEYSYQLSLYLLCPYLLAVNVLHNVQLQEEAALFEFKVGVRAIDCGDNWNFACKHAIMDYTSALWHSNDSS